MVYYRCECRYRRIQDQCIVASTTSARAASGDCGCRSLQCRQVLVDQLSVAPSRACPRQRRAGPNPASKFFLINRDFYLVDLPGYGYAKAPESIRRTWGPLVEGYLAARRNLRVVLVLLDARQGVTERDLQMTRLLDEFSLGWVPVLTKIDKLRRTARQAQICGVAQALGLSDPRSIIPFSAKSGEGRESMLAVIGGCVRTRCQSMDSALTPTSGPARLNTLITGRPSSPACAEVSKELDGLI